VSKKGNALYYVRDVFKKDRDIVLAALKQDSYALQFADKSLHGLIETLYKNADISIF
jgi:hypothetical protein